MELTFWKKGRSTIIIAHRLSTIKDCDTIVMIENGKVLETGSHDELIALNGKYKTWYEIQSAKGENKWNKNIMIYMILL